MWLAGQGLDVLSIDASAVGLAKARRLAEARGVALATLHADLLEWPWPLAAYDVIASIFMHFSSDHRPRLHRAMAEALRPGGLLVIEAFQCRQPGRGQGSPVYQPEDLRRDFDGRLDLLELMAGTIRLDEGRFHQGEAEVVRYLGRKP